MKHAYEQNLLIELIYDIKIEMNTSSSKKASSNGSLGKRFTSLPQDLQRTIASKLDPNARVAIGTLRPDILPTSIEDSMQLFVGPDAYSRSVYQDNHIIQLYLVTDKDPKFTRTIYGQLIIYDDQVVHVKLHHHKVTIYWNSPDHVQLPELSKYMLEDNKPGFHITPSNRLANAAAYKNLLYAFIITLHELHSLKFTADIYTHILTRFRRNDLIKEYPPVIRERREPVQRMSIDNPRSSKKSASSEGWKKLIGQYPKNHMEGVLGHDEAVRTFLKPKTAKQGTKRTQYTVDDDGYTMHNGKRYKTHKGAKGGIHIVVNGHKRYVRV